MGKYDAYPFLDRFTARHRDLVGRTVDEVVPLLDQIHLPFHDLRLCGFHANDDVSHVLLEINGRIARPLLGYGLCVRCFFRGLAGTGHRCRGERGSNNQRGAECNEIVSLHDPSSRPGTASPCEAMLKLTIPSCVVWSQLLRCAESFSKIPAVRSVRNRQASATSAWPPYSVCSCAR